MWLPATKLTYTYQDDDGTKCVKENQEALPKWLAKNPSRVLSICASHKLSDLQAFFGDIHSHNTEQETSKKRTINVSSDGIEETRSGSRKLHVISVMFPGCNQPFPWRTWEFLGKENAPSLHDLLAPVVQECIDNEITIDKFIVDGKEQQSIRGMVATSGFWHCPRCLTKGITSRESKHVHFPPRIVNPTPRQSDMWEEMFVNHADWFENEETKKQTRDLRLGIVQRSPLLDLPMFDIVDSIPPDSMHCMHGGITKRIWERLFNPGSVVFPRKKRKGANCPSFQQVVHKNEVADGNETQDTRNQPQFV